MTEREKNSRKQRPAFGENCVFHPNRGGPENTRLRWRCKGDIEKRWGRAGGGI